MVQNNALFPPVHIRELEHHPPGYVEPAEWFSFQYPFVKKYLLRKLDEWTACNFLRALNCKNVVLYAVTDLAEIMGRDIIQSATDVRLLYFACNDAHRHKDGFLGREVHDIFSLKEDYLDGKIDKIVVCSLFHVNEIFRELMNAGIRLNDLISFTTILYQE